jgi:hypothetical protein
LESFGGADCCSVLISVLNALICLLAFNSAS